MKEKIKRVSVVIPNYNYARYIRARIKSILQQTYPVYEIIVLDDCSTDGSAEMAKSIVFDAKVGRPDLNIKYIGNKENSGNVLKQWKKGFEEAKGDFVWIAEADDLCSRRFLEEAMKGFSDPEVVLSYTESRLISSAGVMMTPNFRWSRDKEKTGRYKKSYIRPGVEEIEEAMAIRCTIPNVSGVVFRKSAEIPIFKYLDEAAKFQQVGDWYFYVKMLGHGKISYNKKAMNHFRIHRGSVTRKAKSKENYEEIVGMHEWFLKDYNVSKKVQGYMKEEEKRIKEKWGI